MSEKRRDVWIRALRRFEFKPHPRQVTVFNPGDQGAIKRCFGDAAIKAGKAVEIPAPNRDEAKAWQARVG